MKKSSTTQASHNHKSETSTKNQEKTSLVDSSDKENDHISRLSVDDHNEYDPSERKLKRKRQTLFNNCTPLSTQRVVKSTRNSRLDDSGKLTVNELEVVLVNDTLESRDENNSDVHEVICVEDSEENVSPGSRFNKVSDIPTNSSNGFLRQRFSLDKDAVLHNHDCASSSKDNEVNVLENRDSAYMYPKPNVKSGTLASEFDRCRISSCVTSTPIDVDTSPVIEDTSTYSSKSDSQSSFLMGGKVVLEPLTCRITPIQWNKSTVSSFTEKPNSQNSDIQSLSDVDRNSEVLIKSSSVSGSLKSSIELKECVVSLEKLRITPLKNKSKYLMAALSADGCVSNRGKSQLSFVVS